MKRIFDIIAASLGIVLLSPLMVGVALLIKLTSPGAIFFRQERLGRSFEPFLMYKFRTMAPNSGNGLLITAAEDSRITSLGRVLRKTKIDELPQLFNVIKGDMSLVGPRPEVRRYVEMFRHDYGEILAVRPGITDLASLHYRDEASLLAQVPDIEEAYVRHILPNKIRLAKEHLQRSSLLFDLGIIFATCRKIVGFEARSALESGDEGRTGSEPDTGRS